MLPVSVFGFRDGKPKEVRRLFEMAVERGEKETLAILAALEAESLSGLDRESIIPYLSSKDDIIRKHAFTLMGKIESVDDPSS